MTEEKGREKNGKARKNPHKMGKPFWKRTQGFLYSGSIRYCGKASRPVRNGNTSPIQETLSSLTSSWCYYARVSKLVQLCTDHWWAWLYINYASVRLLIK